ncbi:MAG: hemerythrin domain-containing protein [Candidatus Bathyarchaeia archaeon]|nr:hemerythrin domain-containing protein [Candidatus Bathyarchaeota archaeon]
MSAIEQLKEEHKAIRLMLKILEAICEKMSKGEVVPKESLEKVMEFIKIFADKCHHGKEEELLFPAMEEAGIPKGGGPISVMIAEHDTGRGYVKAMGEAVLEGDPIKFVENSERYIRLLEQHIDKEDNILYLMADLHLPRDKHDELMEEFDKMERERIGVGRHEELHRLLHQLRKEFLESS